ncbi:ATP12 family chaperone protein [Rhodovibrionaceae bacterium A322]
MSTGGAKRFYKEVSVEQQEDGYVVLLDSRRVLTPAKKPLVFASQALAEAVAAEWSAQEEKIHPGSMPLTSIAYTAVDKVADDRDALLEELVGYGGTEMLCYREEQAKELIDRQNAVWQPLLDWAARELDAPLRLGGGIIHVEQPAMSLLALGRKVSGLDDLTLSALATVVRASGSLIVSLALLEGRLDADGAFEAAELDENYTLEKWGADEEVEKRQADVRAELEAAERLFRLVA